MYKKSGKFIIMLACIGFITALSMDTTVGYEGEKVFNIGLMNKQQNYIIMSVGLLICGVLVRAFGKNDKENEFDTFMGERTIKNQNYQLFLVQRYLIEKNQTIEKYSMSNQVYDTLNLALEKADKEYEKELLGHSSKNTFSIFKNTFSVLKNIFNLTNESKKLIVTKIVFGLFCAATTAAVTMLSLYPEVYLIRFIFDHDVAFDFIFYSVLIFVFILSMTKGNIQIVSRRVFIL